MIMIMIVHELQHIIHVISIIIITIIQAADTRMPPTCQKHDMQSYPHAISKNNIRRDIDNNSIYDNNDVNS